MSDASADTSRKASYCALKRSAPCVPPGSPSIAICNILAPSSPSFCTSRIFASRIPTDAEAEAEAGAVAATSSSGEGASRSAARRACIALT